MTTSFPTDAHDAFPGPPPPPSAWDESRWRAIESWKLARSSRRPFPLKAIGTLLLGIETALRGWDARDSPQPAIADPVYAVLGLLVAALSLTAIAANRAWLFRVMAVAGLACIAEVVAGWAGALPWARWDLFLSGYVQRLVLHVLLVVIAVRRLVPPIDYSRLESPDAGSRSPRAMWQRFRLNRERNAYLRDLPPEQETILRDLERQVRALRHADPTAADDLVDFHAGPHRWRARLYPHGVLLARLGSHEWRAVSPRRFRLRERRPDDDLDPSSGDLVAVIESETLPAVVAPQFLARYRAWAGV